MGLFLTQFEFPFCQANPAAQVKGNLMGNQCICGRSLTDSCVGWGDLPHSEWQTRKLIVEAQVAAKEVHEEIIRLIYPDGSF